jgi:hypothetical protein
VTESIFPAHLSFIPLPGCSTASKLPPLPPGLQIKAAATELGYQADDTFCLKISQLRELFVVRWSVFLLGPSGGRTCTLAGGVIKCLAWCCQQ